MKSILLAILFCFNLSALTAQEIISSFLEKHGRDEGIEYRSIGRKIFSEMKEQGLADSLLLDIVSQLDNISFIYSDDSSLESDYFGSSMDIMDKMKGFNSLYTGEGDDTTVVLTKENKGIIKELVMIVSDMDGFNLISIKGNIPLESFLEYPDFMNLGTMMDLIQQE